MFDLSETQGKARRHTRRIPKPSNFEKGSCSEKANVLSEELIKCLIGIFLDMNQGSPQDREGSSTIVPKLGLSCINSKGFVGKSSYAFLHNSRSNLDPYGILPELDGSIRDIGLYKDLIQITRSSIDMSRFSSSESLPAVEKLRFIPDFRNHIIKLCTIQLLLNIQ